MYEGESQQISQEKSIFLGLSSILTNFNQLLILTHKSILLSNQTQHHLLQSQVHQIEQRAQNGIDFLQLPSSWINSHIHSNNFKTFQRFISRLIQSVTPLKQKALQLPSLRPMIQYLQEIQNLIAKFQENQPIGKVMKLIYQIFLTFCQDMNPLNPQEGLNINYRLVRPQKILLEKKSFPVQKTYYLQTESQKKIRMLNKQLNQTFNTMKGLELDYAHYRSSYFEAKNNQDLFPEFMRRNREIRSNIQLYFRNFREYLTKRQKRKLEKDRINLLRRNKYTEESPKKPLSDVSHKKRSFDFTNSKFPIFKSDLFCIEREQKSRKVDKKQQKTFYKLKSIVISASKIKMGPLKGQKGFKHSENKLGIKSEQCSPPKYKMRNDNRSLWRNLREITKDMPNKY